MRNDRVMSSLLSDRANLLRGLELALYALLGGLCIAQLFPGDVPITLGQAVTALVGESLLALVATVSTPVQGLLGRGRVETIDADILPFRRRPGGRRHDERRAA